MKKHASVLFALLLSIFCLTAYPLNAHAENPPQTDNVASAAEIEALSSSAKTAYNNHDYETALRLWTEAAEMGDAESQDRVGGLYFWGAQYGGVTLIEKDYAKAIEYYEMAMAQGNKDSAQNLTAAYEYTALDYESQDDTETALSYYQKAAALGSPAAIWKAEALSTQETDQTNPYVLMRLGLAAYNEKNYADARIYLETAAKADIPEALNQLAEMYYYGQGVDRDTDRTVELYQRSADQGNLKAIGQLAFMYADSRAIEQDYEKAAELYRQAAEQGDVFSIRNLGTLYADGTGVEQSWETAAALYSVAAMQDDPVAIHFLSWLPAKGQTALEEGDTETGLNILKAAAIQGDLAEAQYIVGNIYYAGDVIDKSYETAILYYKLAAAQGHADALYHLGWMYHWGNGVEKSDPLSFMYYQKAANLGSVKGMLNLGIAYEFGDGTQPSDEMAVLWYLRAADLGDPDAQNRVAGKYLSGEGVEQSNELAAKYYQLAANQGYSPARIHVAELYESGIGVEQSIEEAIRYYQLAADEGYTSAQEAQERIQTNN